MPLSAALPREDRFCSICEWLNIPYFDGHNVVIWSVGSASAVAAGARFPHVHCYSPYPNRT